MDVVKDLAPFLEDVTGLPPEAVAFVLLLLGLGSTTTAPSTPGQGAQRVEQVLALCREKLETFLSFLIFLYRHHVHGEPHAEDRRPEEREVAQREGRGQPSSHGSNLATARR